METPVLVVQSVSFGETLTRGRIVRHKCREIGAGAAELADFRRSPEAAANVLDTGLSRDLETMIERTESELERQLALTRDLMERIESPAPDHPRFRPITRPGDSVCDRRRARLQRHDRGHQR
jgi:hypothetical protein